MMLVVAQARSLCKGSNVSDRPRSWSSPGLPPSPPPQGGRGHVDMKGGRRAFAGRSSFVVDSMALSFADPYLLEAV